MAMDAQALVVIPVVAACSVYSGWALLPAALRRGLATALARLRWFGRLPAIVRAAQRPAGCCCGGCDRAPVKPGTGGTQDVIRIVPRRPSA